MNDIAKTATEVAFRAVGVKKHYPGVHALDGVDLTGYRGEVIAVCGANGAGKSTLARLLAGIETPTHGEILVAGNDMPVRNAAEAERSGVLMMHQEPLIIDDFTIGENVWLYRLRTGPEFRPWSRSTDPNSNRTRMALTAVGLGGLPTNTMAHALSPGQRQMLSLSRAEVTEHQIMILDETTASTSEEHFKEIVELVRRERAAGTCVVFVSHRLGEVFAIADRIAVMRNGKLITVVSTADTTPDAVTTLMIGRELQSLERAPRHRIPAGAPVMLSVQNLTGGGARGVSFDIREGEIVGLYGLVGSGRSSVARTITGQKPAASGTIALRGKPITLKSPVTALRHRIAYVTEDRRREGFINDFDNGSNVSLISLPRLSTRGVINRSAQKRRSKEILGEFQVKGGTEALTTTLSGGNQQKVILAKWMESQPDLVVLDEPTKGIDVGARANIYEIIKSIGARGKSLLVVSSEAEELLSLCHRILVMHDGRITAEFDAEHADTDDLIRTALGSHTS